ncbi:MAG: endo alpha-1,4 polygalactosaminidase [Ramlibacter sp.]|nr:endo alpha-1,4 polygalactosaminidase [Ramlibacter sp.]
MTAGRLRRWLAATALFLIAISGQPARATPTFAFYYGADIPWETLGAYDVAVVEPDHVGPAGWAHRLNPDTTVAAYLSVGEVHPTRPYFARMAPQWKLGENTVWGAIVADQSAPEWRAFFVGQVVKPLWDRGFRAFFLDTLDSFQLMARTPEAQARQVAGLVALVQDIKRAYPEARLVFNRGFEILPQVHSLAWAVAAESLFQGWDAGRQVYRAVPQADRDWLLAQLRKCRDDYQLPVIAIDYVPPGDRALARETARQIKALGIIPWVTDPALDLLGVGQVEALPRQVLAIHDEPGNLAQLASHEIHRVGTLPLNYLGLNVRYVYYGSPELEQLSRLPLAGRFAGVVTWFNRGPFQETAPLMALLNAARTQAVPVAMVGELPGDAAMDAFGRDVGDTVRQTRPLVLHKRSPHVGYEIEPVPNVKNFTPSALRPGQGDVWLRVHSETDGDADVIAITPWGGFAADRYWKVDLPQDNGERWVVDPIAFFRAALKRPGDLPVPDVTTETGRRLLMVHVDGDGFPSRAELPGTPLAGEVLLKEFLERYRWPSTVSIIEGEVSPRGLYPALSPLMEKTAREIFALPHVEMASHTWSHPFYWADAELGIQRPGRVMGLALPGYRYDAAREISGARDYIDRLAPPGKKTRVVLWSGDTQPLATPVRLAYEAGLLNMNSGNTWITRAEPSLTLVGPIGMMKGDWFQVYAPMQNENVYTNLWQGPFYGFERVIETFEMTETPLRLKPVDIYYHLYIATKRASIASLHKAYDWAEAQLRQQRLHPVYASEYIERVLDWRRATVARTDTGLELRGGRFLREWRVEAGSALPAASAASGIAGHVRHATVDYVHASRSIASYDQPARAGGTFYLESANAKLTGWERQGELQTLRFDGHLPLQARFVAPGCTLQPAPGQRAVRRGEQLDVEASGLGTTVVLLRCPG